MQPLSQEFVAEAPKPSAAEGSKAMNVEAYRATEMGTLFERCRPKLDKVSKQELAEGLRGQAQYVAGFFSLQGPLAADGVEYIVTAVLAGDEPLITWADFVSRADRASLEWAARQENVDARTVEVGQVRAPVYAAAAVPATLATPLQPMAAAAAAPRAFGSWAPADLEALATKPEAELRQLLQRKRAVIRELEQDIQWMQASSPLQARMQNLEYLLKGVKVGDAVKVNSAILKGTVDVVQSHHRREHEAAVQQRLEANGGEHKELVGYNATNTHILGRDVMPLINPEQEEEEARAEREAAERLSELESQEYVGHVALPDSFFEARYKQVLDPKYWHGGYHGGTYLEAPEAERQAPSFRAPVDTAEPVRQAQPWPEVRDRVGEAKRGALVVTGQHPLQRGLTVPSWLY